MKSYQKSFLLCYMEIIKFINNIISMISKPTTIIAILLALTIAALVVLPQIQPQSKENLQSELQPNALEVNLKGISSILRTNFTRIFILNDTVYAGENVGSLTVWNFDNKKKKLDFQDISRKVTPSLPDLNKIVHLEALNEGAMALTADGKFTVYTINSASKIIGTSSLNLGDNFSWFTLIKISTSNSSSNADMPPIVATINDKKTQLCLYQTNESIIRPYPVTKLQCNQSTTIKYQHVAYDPMNNLISVGDHTRVIVFQLSLVDDKPTLKYFAQANLPKVYDEGFKSIFSNGTLLTINDLWLSSYSFDVNASTIKLVSSERTQKVVKQGLTSEISAFFDAKAKKSFVMINGKDRVQFFTMANNRLTLVNDSKIIGKCDNFMIHDSNTIIAAVGEELQALKAGDQMDKDYLTVQDEQTIQSSNHFKRVRTMSLWNNSIFMSASEGGKNNLKLWTYHPSDYSLQLVDEKTVTFFSILKSGYLNFITTLWIAPPAKPNTLHIAAAGADPFGLYIVPINAQGKWGSVFRSKDEHTSNITTMMITPDHKQIITGSMDSTVKIWILTTNHDQVQDNTTTVSLKSGPIKFGIQDKTGTYYIFGHSNNPFNSLVNITLWKTDSKHGLVKIAQNVPSQGHETNMSALILSHDEKYIISYSQSGQLKLWRHENWTMVDLMGSLSLGIFDATIQSTQSNKLLLESKNFFTEYYYDNNGFILLGRYTKTLLTPANSSLIFGNTWFSGDEDGSIRVYTFTQ